MTGLLEASYSTDAPEVVPPDQIREQLERMLQTHFFRQSRRYAPMLRFIVEESLAGRGDLLKERILGIEVFHRDSSYDTAADPIVRVTIAEIRKRIAQYYHDEAHNDEPRIELPAGRYEAKFYPSKASLHTREMALPTPAIRPLEPVAVTAVEIPPPGEQATVAVPTAPAFATPAVSSFAPASRPRRRLAIFALAVLVLGLSAAVFVSVQRREALDELWAPLLRPGKQVLICLPTEVGQHRGALTVPSDLSANDAGPVKKEDPTKVTFLEHETSGENVVFSDALAVTKIANLMALRSREYRVRLNVNTTLDDLRQGPAVLIGGLDNQWSIEAISPLRFRFGGNDDEGYWISDAQNPTDHRWFLDLNQAYTRVTRDYALIARVHSRQAGQPQMIIAGIGMSGTMAASEFLADRGRAEELKRRLGKQLPSSEFEIVLGTDVVNGVAGAPQILETWVR